jgi:predicted ATPase with chaperone activity
MLFTKWISPLFINKSLDMTPIYSMADQLLPETPLLRNRSLRSPHNTISHAGLVCGGNRWKIKWSRSGGRRVR